MSEAHLTQHLAIIAHRWPALAESLNQISPLSAANVMEGHCGTLLIDGVQLTSRHNRLAEAQVQANCLPEVAQLNVYGVGLGDLPRVLLLRSTLECLHVFIMNRALFLLSLSVMEQQDWLQDSRVCLALADSEEEIRLPFFALPAELHLAEDKANRIRDRLTREITLPHTNRRYQQHFPMLRQRIADNKRLLKRDGDVASLFNSAVGCQALVIGAGPTLESHIPRLQVLQHHADRPLLIAVDTACRALFAHNIRPDWVVSIDHLIDEEKLPPSDCGLIYFPLVPTRTLMAWRGKRLAAYSSSPLYQPLRKVLPKALLNSGGSVIHPAIDLAVRMGCGEITLLGADFAFPGGKTHTGWDVGALNTTLEQAKHWVLNGHDQRISTNVSFTGYRIQLERYIATHPEVSFWNGSREGAAISGCRYHPEFTS
ncbi:uncharacterized protein DUF115 [Buttiauxella sp. JUb87]|uniref:motility associated factor glycosyltransferase family protein n=1 Tax=Buttiauxella sp. JUb87 TaxID=2485129 RepID=UPI00105D21CB|nr:6-hydroxymethylpterin diphosphokinase MptE-like protein [Buttiauxella sp. JUb87]TDN49802.1 uncharacterized protein DUF115 [Buttiauxella sp. JUb87]